MLIPFGTSFLHYAIYCVFFAIGVACFGALRSIIVVEIFGLEKLTSAFGILLLYMGIAAFVGPSFAGKIDDYFKKNHIVFSAFLKTMTKDFKYSFIVMGGLMMTSGLIALPLRQINAWEQRRSKRTVNENGTTVELRPLTNGANGENPA